MMFDRQNIGRSVNAGLIGGTVSYYMRPNATLSLLLLGSEIHANRIEMFACARFLRTQRFLVRVAVRLCQPSVFSKTYQRVVRRSGFRQFSLTPFFPH